MADINVRKWNRVLTGEEAEVAEGGINRKDEGNKWVWRLYKCLPNLNIWACS